MAEISRQRLKHLFAAALELEPEQRSRFLDEHCHDGALRAELERLLAAATATQDFLEQPPAFGANTLLARLASARIEPFAPHQRLGPYEILEPLGAGGMGHVYRARDVRLDRIVALKVLPPSAARDEGARRRFDLEARAVAKLNHPNICSLYDVGYDEGVDFLVMEYLEGETLAARLAGGALPAGRSCAARSSSPMPGSRSPSRRHSSRSQTVEHRPQRIRGQAARFRYRPAPRPGR